MKLFDSVHGHEVATVLGDEITSRWGHQYKIDGYAVVDDHGFVGEPGQVVGVYDDGKFYVENKLMARAVR